MAVIHCEFNSETLGFDASMKVILPQGPRAKTSDGRLPTLYLLHGLSDDCSAWLRRTSIERYALPYGVAVVMPDGGRSFYTDMENGYKYWTFMTEELPRVARSFFPLSGLREYNYAAGLSMGGYGALKLALGKPDMFAAAASLSGATDMASLAGGENGWKKEMENIFGDLKKIRGSGNDLFALAEKVSKKRKNRPALYCCCGTEDFLYEANVKFKKHCAELKYPLTYEEAPGGHDWAFWDEHIQRVLKWLPIPELERASGQN